MKPNSATLQVMFSGIVGKCCGKYNFIISLTRSIVQEGYLLLQGSPVFINTHWKLLDASRPHKNTERPAKQLGELNISLKLLTMVVMAPSQASTP